MKRILYAVMVVTMAGCGGGGGGNVRVQDPTGIRSDLEATGFSDSSSYLHVTEGGYPVFVDRRSLDEQSQAAADAIRDGTLTYQRAGERVGLQYYRASGPIAFDVEGREFNGNIDGYGAWGEHNTFLVVGVGVEDITIFQAFSGGRFSESNPMGDMGTATWQGAMIGESGDKFLSGNSTIIYDFSAATIDVRLSGIRDWNTPQTYPDLVWEDLDVRNGTFTDTYTIRGSFYGPNHQEAGGVFDRRSITGAFGAKREE